MKCCSYLCKKIRDMGLFILLVICIIVEAIWSPRLDFIQEENMLLLHYNKKHTRGYLVIFKL